jgi:circadian clock protein KaiC
LEPWVKKGLLQFHSIRPTFCGLEMHLATMFKVVKEFNPRAIVLDPINSFLIGTNEMEAKLMLMRLIDFLKLHEVTGFFTTLNAAGTALEHTDMAISSAIDTWLLLRDIEIGGERNRGIYILKSRGMKHSNQIREFLLTDNGVELLDVYVGADGVLTGTARVAQESKEKALKLINKIEIQRKQLDLERKRKALEAQIALLKLEFEKDEIEALKVIASETAIYDLLAEDRTDMAKNRQADLSAEIIGTLEYKE